MRLRLIAKSGLWIARVGILYGILGMIELEGKEDPWRARWKALTRMFDL